MKLNVEPCRRRSWDCILTDGAGARVATTQGASPAGFCGLLPRVDGSIQINIGALAQVLRVEDHSRRWVLTDARGRQLATAIAHGSKMYVRFAVQGVTVRWAPAAGRHRHLEALWHEGKGGKKLSMLPVGTFQRISGFRCRCTAEFNDDALSIEAQLFLTWLGVRFLQDDRQRQSHAGHYYASPTNCSAGGC